MHSIAFVAACPFLAAATANADLLLTTFPASDLFPFRGGGNVGHPPLPPPLLRDATSGSTTTTTTFLRAIDDARNACQRDVDALCRNDGQTVLDLLFSTSPFAAEDDDDDEWFRRVFFGVGANEQPPPQQQEESDDFFDLLLFGPRDQFLPEQPPVVERIVNRNEQEAGGSPPMPMRDPLDSLIEEMLDFTLRSVDSFFVPPFADATANEGKQEEGLPQQKPQPQDDEEEAVAAPIQETEKAVADPTQQKKEVAEQALDVMVTSLLERAAAKTSSDRSTSDEDVERDPLALTSQDKGSDADAVEDLPPPSDAVVQRLVDDVYDPATDLASRISAHGRRLLEEDESGQQQKRRRLSDEEQVEDDENLRTRLARRLTEYDPARIIFFQEGDGPNRGGEEGSSLVLLPPPLRLFAPPESSSAASAPLPSLKFGCQVDRCLWDKYYDGQTSSMCEQSLNWAKSTYRAMLREKEREERAEKAQMVPEAPTTTTTKEEQAWKEQQLYYSVAINVVSALLGLSLLFLLCSIVRAVAGGSGRFRRRRGGMSPEKRRLKRRILGVIYADPELRSRVEDAVGEDIGTVPPLGFRALRKMYAERRGGGARDDEGEEEERGRCCARFLGLLPVVCLTSLLAFTSVTNPTAVLCVAGPTLAVLALYHLLEACCCSGDTEGESVCSCCGMTSSSPEALDVPDLAVCSCCGGTGVCGGECDGCDNDDGDGSRYVRLGEQGFPAARAMVTRNGSNQQPMAVASPVAFVGVPVQVV